LGARWKVLAGVGAIAAVVLVGLMLARPVGKATGISPQPPPIEPTAQPPQATDVATASAQPGQPSPSAAQTNGQLAPTLAGSANVVTNWEGKLDDILAAQVTTDVKAQQMLEMFPRLPEAGQVEMATHLCNLVTDENYAQLGQLLASPQLPQDVLDTLMADVLNRPNGLKLPTLLEVARTADHPKAEDAKEVLRFFLDGDYGDDWTKWQEKVQEWLKNNPD
jgi:hypothetical protein